MSDKLAEVRGEGNEVLRAEKIPLRFPTLVTVGRTTLLAIPEHDRINHPDGKQSFKPVVYISDGEKSKKGEQGSLLSIGRGPDKSFKVPVGDLQASRNHANISVTEKGVVLEDEDTTNGTELHTITDLPTKPITIDKDRDLAFNLGGHAVIIEVGDETVSLESSIEEQGFIVESKVGSETYRSVVKFFDPRFHSFKLGAESAKAVHSEHPDFNKKAKAAIYPTFHEQAELIMFESTAWIKNKSADMGVKVGYENPGSVTSIFDPDKRDDTDLSTQARPDALRPSIDDEFRQKASQGESRPFLNEQQLKLKGSSPFPKRK